MMAGNPNWCWSMIMNDMHPPDQPQISSDTNVSSQFPLTSWSQLLLQGGLVDGEEEEEERLINKFENSSNWEEQQVLQNPSNFTRIINTNYNNYYYDNNSNNNHVVDHVIKQEQLVSQLTTNGGQLDDDDRDREILLLSNFSNNNNNFFNFSGSSVKAAAAAEEKTSVHHHNQDHRSSHECNSRSSTGVVSKKARVYHSSAQPALKQVRKEKLGDRITALHQLVSPFGKTDTASVLSEAIANIRFLQARIQALSFPYMRNASTVNITGHHIHQHSVQERNCLIQEDAADQVSQSPEAKDLRSRGLCLVPISCTENIGNDNGADYWAPSPIGGEF